jgi:hypothetical protein
MTTSLLHQALIWRDLGVATLPIKARDKAPAIDSWSSYQTELPGLRELNLWFSSGRYNLAVVTGWGGLVVVDFDDPWRYSLWISGLDEQVRDLALLTYRVRTRRSWHYYFWCAAPVTCWPGDGVDVKAAGGYVLAPPSVHPSGHVYEAVGRVRHISRINRIEAILPDYRANPEQSRPTKRGKRDVYDLAMRKEAGVRVAEVKSRWRFSDLLPGSARPGRRWRTQCPLHRDEQASFVVYPDGHAHCYGCGWHGDVIDLYADVNDITLVEAMKEMMR